MAGTHPLAGATDRWEAVIEDLEATAAEYEAEGWETITCHPGDVTPLPTTTALLNGVDVDRLGLDVVLPGDEFEAVAAAVADATFDEYDAYRAETDSLVFLVIAMKSAETVVLFPVYYDPEQAGIVLKRVAERGELRTYLRPLDDAERVVFSQAEPERLLPADFDPDEVDEEALLADAGSDQSRYPLAADDLEAELNDRTDGDETDGEASDERE